MLADNFWPRVPGTAELLSKSVGPVAVFLTVLEPMQKNFSPALSLYLDLTRFLAAVSVVLYHTWPMVFPNSRIKWPGHEAVVVFFVLSGFVIAYVCSRPGTTLAAYVQHRAARILPASYLALLLAFVVALFTATSGGLGTLWSATMANFFFVAQSGMWAVEAPLNPPFWSLNYEVWYYVIFGAWTFSSRKWRNGLTVLALLLAGPKILMLFPVWLMGVFLFRRMPSFGAATAVVLFVATLALGAAMTWLNLSDVIRTWLYAAFPPIWRAHYSTQFIYDILLGLVVALNFAAVASMSAQLRFLGRAEGVIRYLSGFTFSLYVFHGPLMVALDGFGLTPYPLAFFACMLAAIYLLAELTERRTPFFRRLLEQAALPRRQQRPT